MGQFTFKAAEGIRPSGPLLSVSQVNARGIPTWFDGDRSYILPGNPTEIAALRALVQKVENKVPLHLKNGVFKLRAW